MKNYIVSMDIVTSLSIAESDIAALLGLMPSVLTFRQLKEDAILWRYEPSVDENMPLVDRINLIASEIRPSGPIPLTEKIKTTCLSIGVFHDLATCTVSLPAHCCDLLSKKLPDLSIEITCYPVEEGQTT